MKKRRGIALITTLMLAGLLLLLLGAFMQVNRSQFALLGGSGDREAALRTIMSAQEFCVSKLERDETWAKDVFSGDYEEPLDGRFMTVKEIGGERTLEGSIPSLDSTFSVQIENDLAGTQRVTLRISATTGTLTRNAVVKLRPAPLYDSAVAAGGAVRVNASAWDVGSRDPYRNVVRATGDIDAPDHADVNFVSKPNAAGDSGTDRGIFWANDDITFYVGASRESVTDPQWTNRLRRNQSESE